MALNYVFGSIDVFQSNGFFFFAREIVHSWRMIQR